MADQTNTQHGQGERPERWTIMGKIKQAYENAIIDIDNMLRTHHTRRLDARRDPITGTIYTRLPRTITRRRWTPSTDPRMDMIMDFVPDGKTLHYKTGTEPWEEYWAKC